MRYVDVKSGSLVRDGSTALANYGYSCCCEKRVALNLFESPRGAVVYNVSETSSISFLLWKALCTNWPDSR